MKSKKYTCYHKDGTIWAKGEMLGKKMHGFWVWFRKDGSKMRSGYFKNGKQIGEWITYGRRGKIIKKTMMKEK